MQQCLFLSYMPNADINQSILFSLAGVITTFSKVLLRYKNCNELLVLFPPGGIMIPGGRRSPVCPSAWAQSTPGDLCTQHRRTAADKQQRSPRLDSVNGIVRGWSLIVWKVSFSSQSDTPLSPWETQLGRNEQTALGLVVGGGGGVCYCETLHLSLR